MAPLDPYCRHCGLSHHSFERVEAVVAACLNGVFAVGAWLTHAR